MYQVSKKTPNTGGRKGKRERKTMREEGKIGEKINSRKLSVILDPNLGV